MKGVLRKEDQDLTALPVGCEVLERERGGWVACLGVFDQKKKGSATTCSKGNQMPLARL